MPDEPNRPITELLRGYSRQRRQNPPPELHPASRKMLQDEVERVYGKESAKRTWDPFFRRFWPQFAFGLSLFIILIGLLVPSRAPRKTIQRDSQEQPKPAVRSISPAKAPALASPQSPPETGATVAAPGISEPAPSSPTSAMPLEPEVKTFKRERRATAPVERGFAPGNAPAPLLKKARQESALADQAARNEAMESPVQKTAPERDSEGVALSNPLPPSPHLAAVDSLPESTRPLATTNRATVVANTRSLQAVNSLTNLGNALRTTFVAPTNDASGVGLTASASPILTNFKFEQLGERIQITDEDGSVYSGVIQTTPQPPTNLVALIDNAAVFPFQAHGTNETFAEPVTIRGQLFQRTNSLPSPEDTFAFRVRPSATGGVAGGPGKPGPLHMRAITGKVIIGRTNQFPVRALSQEP